MRRFCFLSLLPQFLRFAFVLFYAEPGRPRASLRLGSAPRFFFSSPSNLPSVDAPRDLVFRLSQAAFAAHKGQIAGVILEPVVGNSGFIVPDVAFLKGIRELTTQNGALLCFDEVMTGFRIAYGGAQEHFGITPDLTTMGKVIGGGLPVGAFGGRKDIMKLVAPAGPMYQAGTLSGNPLAMTAGIKTLEILKARASPLAPQGPGESVGGGGTHTSAAPLSSSSPDSHVFFSSSLLLFRVRAC